MNEKIKACLLTGALGNAFGSRFEQMDLPTEGERWHFTGDTQLTMATCEAILEHQRPQPKMVAVAFQRWYSQGQLSGLDASTIKALVELMGGGDVAKVGANDELAAGNGAAMRIAPLAFLLDPKVEADRDLFRNICRITHHNEEAYVGGLAVLYAIRFGQNDQQNFISNIIRLLPESRVRERLVEISQAPAMRIRDLGRKFGSSGFVVDSIPLALIAAQQAPELGIENMMKEIVAAGGDAATNCSIAGQIAGLQLGMEAIPAEWMEMLRKT
ncbi:MAG TPA: hypothetical protein ENJ82_11670, partial [Bacteroidetes bacterium]|nr:hypothetical protein [Bacteroidota bacterium]